MKTINQQELINIYRTLHSKCKIHTPFKFSWNIYQGRPFMGHKANLNKFERTEIMHRMFSECNGIKLIISVIKITGRFLNTRKLNNAHL